MENPTNEKILKKINKLDAEISNSSSNSDNSKTNKKKEPDAIELAKNKEQIKDGKTFETQYNEKNHELDPYLTDLEKDFFKPESTKVQTQMMSKIDKNFSDLEKNILSLSIKNFDQKINFSKEQQKDIKKKLDEIYNDLLEELDLTTELNEKNRNVLKYFLQVKKQEILDKVNDIIENKTIEKTIETVDFEAEKAEAELQQKQEQNLDVEQIEEKLEKTAEEIKKLAEQYAVTQKNNDIKENSDDSFKKAIKLITDFAKTTNTQPNIFVRDLLKIFDAENNKKTENFLNKLIDLFEYKEEIDNEGKLDSEDITHLQGPALNIN
ncbi:MAG: hypothetical protein WC414_00760 [Patescibacteria group bacterium]